MKYILLSAIAIFTIISSCKKQDDDSATPNSTCTQEANFSAIVDSVGEQMQFTDASTGEVASYLWQFGDGSTSTDKNPTHQYTMPGEKNVCLTVANADGKCSVQKCLMIAVPVAAVAVEHKNRALLIDFSETWCPPCGSYGGPAFDSLLYLEDTKITMMKVYGSSNPSTLNAPFAATMQSDYSLAGVPSFFVNSNTIDPSGGVFATIYDNYIWANGHATTFAYDTIKAGLVISKSITANTMTVDAKVKFLTSKPAGKTYRLAVFVVEKNIVAAQSVTGGFGTEYNYVHNNLLRACSNPTTYKGDILNVGNVAINANQIYNKSFSINLQSAWVQSNLKVIAVVWETSATGKPKMINSVVLK